MPDYFFYVLSFCFGVMGAWVVVRFAGRLGLLDIPDDRSSHHAPTPKGGGAGILAAFILCVIVTGMSMVFWIPISFLSILSFFGDRFALSAKLRLGVQTIVVGFLIVGSGFLPSNPLLVLPWVLFCILFIVGTANFYNFMDGINGLAAITGIIAFPALAVFGYLAGNNAYINLCFCLTLATVGFLPFNFPRAKVFMGDVGSILLGLCFGVIVVFLAKTPLDFLCLSGFLFPFYADELSTMIFRVRERENLLKPHRRHIYQLLVNQMGFSHWIVTTAYGMAQALVIVCVFVLRPHGFFAVLLFLFVAFGAVVVLRFKLRRITGW